MRRRTFLQACLGTSVSLPFLRAQLPTRISPQHIYTSNDKSDFLDGIIVAYVNSPFQMLPNTRRLLGTLETNDGDLKKLMTEGLSDALGDGTPIMKLCEPPVIPDSKAKAKLKDDLTKYIEKYAGLPSLADKMKNPVEVKDTLKKLAAALAAAVGIGQGVDAIWERLPSVQTARAFLADIENFGASQLVNSLETMQKVGDRYEDIVITERLTYQSLENRKQCRDVWSAVYSYEKEFGKQPS